MAADKVSVGYTPNWSPCANIAIALEKTNICEKNGLECDVISFVAGAPQMEAMLAGKLDIALVGDAPSVAFAARGGKGRWRSEERRVGKECVSTCRSRWSSHH